MGYLSDEGPFQGKSGLWLDALILLAISITLVFKHFVMAQPPGPILWDEWQYKENAQLILHGRPFVSTHYPPLYSLVIGIAFCFRDWYAAIQAVNGILLSLLAVPVWLISRMFVSRTNALLAVLMTLLLPFQAIYPGFVMSENLFVPVFLFAVYFALQGAGSATWKAALFGAFLAFGYLTRYLMLPAIPVLVAGWLLVPLTREEGMTGLFRSRRFMANVTVLAVAFILCMLPWILYAVSSHLQVSMALGGAYTAQKGLRGFSGGLFMGGSSPGNLLMWGTTVALYIILAASPFLIFMKVYLPGAGLPAGNPEHRRRVLFFLLLSVVLVLLFWLISVQHSFRASYNYPVPARLMGRYVIHLGPLFIIAGIITLERLFAYPEMIRKRVIPAAVVSMLLMVLAAKWILFRKGIWSFSPALANNFFDTPGSLSYNFNAFYYMTMAMILLLGGLIGMLPRAGSRSAGVLYFMTVCILIAWRAGSFSLATTRARDNTCGIHARNLASFLAREKLNARDSTLVYSVRYTWQEYWESLPLFWGAPHLKYVAAAGKIKIADSLGTFLYITEDSLPVKALASYRFLDGKCYLYRLKADSIMFKPVVSAYDPAVIRAGRDFNVRQQGGSVLQLRARLLSGYYTVLVNGHELKPEPGHDRVIRVPVPKEFYAGKGTLKIEVRDDFFGKISNPVNIEVR